MFGWELPAQATPELDTPTSENLGAGTGKVMEVSYSPEGAAVALAFLALQV